MATLGLLLAYSTLGQTKPPLTGTVTRKDGKPIAGVAVYGSASCCPVTREPSTTDKEGQFRLDHPGMVIHFHKDNLQPQAFVLQPGTSEVHITMEPSSGSLVLPICGKPVEGQKRVGWGKQGIQFNVPKRSVRILGGTPDVDYVRWVIQPKESDSYLELWFGPYAIDEDPGDKLFISSASFAQRHIVDSDGAVCGTDSWGNLRSGGSWRQTVVLGFGGSRYRGASQNDARLFDQIVNSVCIMPHPNL